MNYFFDTNTTQEFNRAISLEWIETNGLGGYASSTIIGTNTRRYHGLLVASMKPPVQRNVILSKMDESIKLNGQTYELGTNKYHNAIYPTGYIFQESFQKNMFPEFMYSLHGIKLKKTIAAVHGENTTLIIYEVLQADTPFVLDLLPLTAPRDFHQLSCNMMPMAWDSNFERGILHHQANDQSPPLYISVPGSSFEYLPDWYYNFEYPVELERVQGANEDLFTPGRFSVQLKEGDRLGIIASTDAPHGRNALSLFEAEKYRRESLLEEVPDNHLAKTLTLAADQFIVSRGEEGKSIIAGYPWFSDWGRDTMISLPGLCMATNRYDDARRILLAYADNVSEGMIPNRFSDYGEESMYNTADATLWFFVAIYQYLSYSGDKEFVLDYMLPVLEDIIFRHQIGTRFGIRVDTDGLLEAGEADVQLTWMDAKVGDWIVTPRRGKAVEINALWYNALRIYSYLQDLSGNLELAQAFQDQARGVKRTFQDKFWNYEGEYLYDLVDGEYKDASIRPNQIFALSLPFPLLEGERATQVLDVVTTHLYTPKGLRSLSPLDSAYKDVYIGDIYARDGAYHQGTVWAWLLGPYVDAVMYVQKNFGKYKAKQVLADMASHLGEAGVGTISEIFDGAAPYIPRGCFAQAWSVAEMMRVADQYELWHSSLGWQESQEKAVASRKVPVPELGFIPLAMTHYWK